MIEKILFLLYIFRSLFKRGLVNTESKELLIIRMDAIGDYILFRNHIKLLRQSEEYKNSKITLLGNKRWKELSVFLDGVYIDNFIWIDTVKFRSNSFYRRSKLKFISSKEYGTAINPVYSRNFFLDEQIFRYVRSRKKIISSGDLSNSNTILHKLNFNHNHKIIQQDEGITFEFYRNKDFFEKIIFENKCSEGLFIDRSILRANTFISMPSDYVVIFIGASDNKRKWNEEKYAEITNHIRTVYGYEIVVCGGKNEINNVLNFSEKMDGSFYNFVGNQSLVETMNLISNCKFLVSNETFAAHMAIALNVDSFVISNGNHYGRFTPYPEGITNKYHGIYPAEITNVNDTAILIKNFGYGSCLDINEVSVASVISKIDGTIHANDQH